MPRPRAGKRRRVSIASLDLSSIESGAIASLLYHLFRANSRASSLRGSLTLSSPFLSLATVSSFSVREMYKPQRGSAHRKSQSSPAGFFCTWRSKGGR